MDEQAIRVAIRNWWTGHSHIPLKDMIFDISDLPLEDDEDLFVTIIDGRDRRTDVNLHHYWDGDTGIKEIPDEEET